MTVRSFAERHADEQKREALETMTLTERLLAHVLIELMEMRSRRGYAAIASRLRHVGLSSKQIAALLNTTPASLAIIQSRTDESGTAMMNKSIKAVVEAERT